MADNNDNNNFINKKIKDNIQIEDNKNIENEIKEIVNNEDKDKSFNQLMNLQLLIQKHSGLKELCKNEY